MKADIQQIAQDVVQSPKTTATVLTATTGTGISTLLEWLPFVAGLSASIVGLLGSCVLIYTMLRRDRREAILHKAELEAIGKRRT